MWPLLKGVSMNRVALVAGLAAGACGLLLAAQSVAQTSPVQGTNQPAIYRPTSPNPGHVFEPPRTPEGRPDFQSVVWAANHFAMMEAVPMMLPPDLVLSEEKAKQAFDRMMAIFLNNPMIKAVIETDPEASALLTETEGLPIVRGERRTRLLVVPADGKLPYTPEARRHAAGEMTRMAATRSDNPEERTVGERCIALGGKPPMAMMSSLHPRQFIQTANHILIHSEYGDEVRIIPFSPAHGPAALRRPMGDSIARWDGDTLVIETTAFQEGDTLRGAFPLGLIVNPDAKVIERYTRVSEDELLYQFTIEDPKVYSAPWLAEYSLYRAPFRMFPGGCHEANYSLSNILRGQRVADARRADAK